MRHLYTNLKNKIARYPLKTKLRFFGYAIIIPFALLMVYQLVCMIRFCGSYDQIVQNITMIKYNINFKDDVDYSVYRMIVSDLQADEVDEIEGVSNPYDSIKELEAVVKRVYSITSGQGNKQRIKRLLTIVEILKERVADIDNNIKAKGHYDENIMMLDNNIRNLTSIIEENQQQYIYYEVAALEETRQELRRSEVITSWTSVAIFLLIFTYSSILSVNISSSISKPMEALCEATELVAKGDFDTRTEIAAGDEITILTTSFNRMIEQIGELVVNIKKEQINLKDMELKLLQEQIKPHFLYNTLDAIIWLAEANDTKKVVFMVSALSDFFRTSLSGGKDEISVKEEEIHIKSYLEIQQVRYQDILEYRIEIPNELKENNILKLTLQPLVENALYHGLKKRRQKGLITITAEKIGENLIFCITDNGIGMTEEELSNLQRNIKNPIAQSSSKGFGLRNVEERIRINYGSEYGLTIESSYGIGTKAYVKLPCRYTVIEHN